jgi:hypothetical protein
MNTLHRRINSWAEIQASYIPGVTVLRSKATHDMPLDLPTAPVYSVELWLPSSIGRRTLWDKRLGEFEWQFREAQARDALNTLRQNLRLKDFLIKKKKDWARGVHQNTRSQVAIVSAANKIKSCIMKYRVARTALTCLASLLNKGDTWGIEFQVLKDEDVVGLPVEGWGEGSRMLSWIWIIAGANRSEMDQPRLTDGSCFSILVLLKYLTHAANPALRLQWCRSRARSIRWSEEVSLLQEEMRRVLACLTWHEQQWILRAQQPHQSDPALSEGYLAYALRQADMYVTLHTLFGNLWYEIPSWIESGLVPQGDELADVEAEILDANDTV